LPTDVSPDAELFAVTANVSVLGAFPAGTVGARKVCCDPSPFVGVSVIPCGATQVYVSGPPAESTPDALSVTFVPLATGFVGAELAFTEGGAGAAGGAIGTVTVAVAGVVELFPPTLNWNVRFVLAATVGAVKVAVALDAFARFTLGSPGFMTCVHEKGPLVGVLPAELSVTWVPATIGVAAPV
jgi:hypothetical protein